MTAWNADLPHLDPGIAAAGSAPTFVRCRKRFTDDKEHRRWSVVKSCRVRGDRVARRHVLHPGEINDIQRGVVLRDRSDGRPVGFAQWHGLSGLGALTQARWRW